MNNCGLSSIFCLQTIYTFPLCMQIRSVRPRCPFCTLNADQAVTMMSSFCMMSLSIVFQKKRLQHIPGTMSNLWTHGTFDCCENIGNCKGNNLSIYLFINFYLPIIPSTNLSIYLYVYLHISIYLYLSSGLFGNYCWHG